MAEETITTQARLTALYEIGTRLGTTLDLTELLNLVMDSIIQLAGAERGFLMLVDSVTRDLQIKVARNVDQETIDSHSMEISRNITQRVATSGEPLLTDNAQDDDRFSAHQSVVGYQLRSIMCAPLRARGKVIGVVYVDNRLYSGVFSEADLELLTAFANQAAVAIENARLFAQTDQALARRVEELTLFQRIDQELNRSLDLDRVLSLALHWAITLTGADGGSIGLVERPEQGPPFLRLLAHEGGEDDAPATVPADHPVLARILREKTSISTFDATDASAIDGTAAASQLAVPIKQEGRVTGLITLESDLARAFNQEDIAFVERLADRSAVAIENSRLYAAVRAADQAKSDFISLVTHELRIPMTSIKGYTDLLLGGMVGELNEQQQQFLDTIKRNLERMSVLVRDLSDINRIESSRMNFEHETFEIQQAIQDAADSMRKQIEAHEQTLSLELDAALPPVYADRTRIGQVLTNLINNAHKYTPEKGAITVRAGQNGQYVFVTVTDNGIGISEEDQEKLFTQFFRSDNEQVRAQAGWGLGLSIVKKLVEAQDGEISFESELGSGSSFTFTVPVATS